MFRLALPCALALLAGCESQLELTGTLLHPDGAPIAEFELGCGFIVPGSLQSEHWDVATTDDTGTFRCRAPSGTYHLSIRAEWEDLEFTISSDPISVDTAFEPVHMWREPPSVEAGPERWEVEWTPDPWASSPRYDVAGVTETQGWFWESTDAPTMQVPMYLLEDFTGRFHVFERYRAGQLGIEVGGADSSPVEGGVTPATRGAACRTADVFGEEVSYAAGECPLTDGDFSWAPVQAGTVMVILDQALPISTIVVRGDSVSVEAGEVETNLRTPYRSPVPGPPTFEPGVPTRYIRVSGDRITEVSAF